MLRSISQHRLHQRTLELEDERIEKASLFPLFDRAGRTRALMLISEESGEIRLVEWRSKLFEWRWFQPLRLRMSRDELAAGRGDLGLETLWHFDPWWELGDQRYDGNPRVPALKETNLAGHDGSVTRTWFDSGLSRVSWVATGSGEAMRLARYSPFLLRAAEEHRRRTASPADSEVGGRRGWRLRPFWG